jgi:ABC-type branched-subunit amino acid transport system ATPase component
MVTKHVLEASGIRIAFDGRQILSDIYLRVESGEVLGIVGRNGQGKSTLLKMIYGTLRAEQSIVIDGVFQRQAFKNFRAIRYQPQFSFLPGRLSMRRVFADYEVEMDDFFARFAALKAEPETRIDMLSGGWRRMIETYIVLCSKTHFVMLDEPFTHISPVMIEALQHVIAREKANKGIILTDHMIAPLLEASTSLYMLRDGHLARARSAADLAWLGYRVA